MASAMQRDLISDSPAKVQNEGLVNWCCRLEICGPVPDRT